MKDRQDALRSLTGYLFALGSTAIWAGNFAIARAFNQSVTPITIAFFRWTVATIAIAPFAVRHIAREWGTVKKHLPYLVLTSLLGVTTFNTLIYYAGRSTTALNMALISITFPIFIIILSRFLFGERITKNKILGILFVIAGVVVLITKGEFSRLRNIQFAMGDALMLLAAIAFAVYSILLRKRPEGMSLWTLQASTFAMGLVFLSPFFVADRLTAAPLVITLPLVLAFLYIGVVASLTAFVLWNKSIEKIGASKAGMVYYTMPLISGFLGYFVLGEGIGMIHLYSLLLIVPGILVANYERKKPTAGR